MCRLEKSQISKSLGGDSFGYTSGMSPTNAAMVWSNIHEIAIRAIVVATVALEGGVDRVIATQRSVVFCLQPREDASDDNPAKAFTLLCVP